MKVRFTPRARLDLIGIADYIRTRNAAGSPRVRQAILGSLQIVAVFPEMGRQQNVPGIRKFVTRRYRYLIYYTVNYEHEEILVLTIQHPARRREYWDI